LLPTWRKTWIFRLLPASILGGTMPFYRRVIQPVEHD
jgi:hypothetical protein